MRRLVPALAVLGALGGWSCGSRPAATTPQSMNQVVEQFLTAVKANDVERIGHLWGDQHGAAAEHMKPDVLRKRTTVLQIYLANAGFRIVEGPLPVIGHDDQRTFRVELQRARCNVVTPIDVVRTSAGSRNLALRRRVTYSVSSSRMPAVVLGCRNAMRRPPAPRRGAGSTRRYPAARQRASAPSRSGTR